MSNLSTDSKDNIKVFAKLANQDSDDEYHPQFENKKKA
jgi:hypothetical protein